VILRSHIGWPSPKYTDTAFAHGNALGEDEVRAVKEILGLDADEHFQVPDDVRVGSLEVTLDVSHTWIGDLKIDLTHGSVVKNLWNRAGGHGHDIRVTLPVSEFDGASASGAWSR